MERGLEPVCLIAMRECQSRGTVSLRRSLLGQEVGGAELRGAGRHWGKIPGAERRGAERRGAELRGEKSLGQNVVGQEVSGAGRRGAELRGAGRH